MPASPRSKVVEPLSAGCQIEELFHLLGKSHMLPILHIFNSEPGPHRFVDIQRRLHLSPNTLSERLKDLVNAGLATRVAFNEIPPRVDYQATAKALELTPVFASLGSWAAKNNLRGDGPAALVAA